LGVVNTTTATIAVDSNFTAVASAGGLLATNVVALVDGGAGAGTVAATFNLGTAVNTFSLALAENGAGGLTVVGARINGANTGAAATITGTNGADNITGGAFADTLRGNGGADTITGGGGVDTFVFTTAVSADVITDFSVATNEIAAFNVAALNAANGAAGGATTLKNGLMAAVTAGTVSSVQTVNAAAVMTAANMIILTGNYGALINAENAIEAGGARALTTVNATAANDSFLVAWADNTGTYHLSAYVATGVTAAGAPLVAVNGALADIATIGTTLPTATNFQFS